VAGEAGSRGSAGAAAGEVGKHLVGVNEENLEAARTGLGGKGRREWALAHAVGPYTKTLSWRSMNWPVARSKTWALLSLGLKLKSKPSSVLVGSKAARRSRKRSLLCARRSTSSCSSRVRNSTKDDCCSTAWRLRTSSVSRMPDRRRVRSIGAS